MWNGANAYFCFAKKSAAEDNSENPVVQYDVTFT